MYTPVKSLSCRSAPRSVATSCLAEPTDWYREWLFSTPKQLRFPWPPTCLCIAAPAWISFLDNTEYRCHPAETPRNRVSDWSVSWVTGGFGIRSQTRERSFFWISRSSGTWHHLFC